MPAQRTLSLATPYAIWTGNGMVGTAIVGMIVMNEDATLVRITCVMVVVTGVIGLKLATPAR
ncbi:MAG: SMR family transporter [Dokdonella sp.]